MKTLEKVIAFVFAGVILSAVLGFYLVSPEVVHPGVWVGAQFITSACLLGMLCFLTVIVNKRERDFDKLVEEYNQLTQEHESLQRHVGTIYFHLGFENGVPVTLQTQNEALFKLKRIVEARKACDAEIHALVEMCWKMWGQERCADPSMCREVLQRPETRTYLIDQYNDLRTADRRHHELKQLLETIIPAMVARAVELRGATVTLGGVVQEGREPEPFDSWAGTRRRQMMAWAIRLSLLVFRGRRPSCFSNLKPEVVLDVVDTPAMRRLLTSEEEDAPDWAPGFLNTYVQAAFPDVDLESPSATPRT